VKTSCARTERSAHLDAVEQLPVRLAETDVARVERVCDGGHLALAHDDDLRVRALGIPCGAVLPIRDGDQRERGAALALEAQQRPETGLLVVLVGEDAGDVHSSRPPRIRYVERSFEMMVSRFSRRAQGANLRPT
jgi:hypothetical protein